MCYTLQHTSYCQYGNQYIYCQLRAVHDTLHKASYCHYGHQYICLPTEGSVLNIKHQILSVWAPVHLFANWEQCVTHYKTPVTVNTGTSTFLYQWRAVLYTLDYSSYCQYRHQYICMTTECSLYHTIHAYYFFSIEMFLI